MRVNDQEVLATGKVIEIIEEVRVADGSVRHWLVQKFPLVRSAETVWVGGPGVWTEGKAPGARPGQALARSR